MKHREFVCTDKPKLNLNENKEFLLNYQKAVFYTLENRNLLQKNQCEKCIEKLELKSMKK